MDEHHDEEVEEKDDGERWRGRRSGGRSVFVVQHA